MITHFVWEYRADNRDRQAQLDRARATWSPDTRILRFKDFPRMSAFFNEPWLPGELRVVTNADSCLVAEAYDYLESVGTSVCSHRRNVNRAYKGQMTLPQARYWGTHFIGVDLIAVTEEWWKTVGRSLPDMLFGWEGWDWVWKIGIGCVTTEDLVYHEPHGVPYWHQNRDHPNQLINRGLARGWVDQRPDKEIILSEWPLLRNDFTFGEI